MEKRAGFSRIFGFVRLGVSRRKESSGIWGAPALWNPVWSCVLGWAKLSCLHTVVPKVGQGSFKYVLLKKNEIHSGVWMAQSRPKKPGATTGISLFL